jgi:hypothetical protein
MVFCNLRAEFGGKGSRRKSATMRCDRDLECGGVYDFPVVLLFLNFGLLATYEGERGFEGNLHDAEDN